MLAGKILYQDLRIYQHAHDFVLLVYKVSENFPASEDNNVSSQLRRAAISIPLNIAEGTGAMSYRVFLNFLCFSYRSCLEIQACLRLCKDLGYLSKELFADVWERQDKLVRMIFKYMKSIEAQCDKKHHRSYVLPKPG